MRAHPDPGVEVARRPAAAALAALAAQPDPAPVGHAGGNADGHRLPADAAVCGGPTDRQALLAAARGLEQIELELGLHVGAAPCRRLAAPAPTLEELREQVVEVAEGEALAGAAARELGAAAEAGAEGLPGAARRLRVEAALERDLAELVVEAPLLRIREHRVGLGDRLEALLGGLVGRVHVRVVTPRELAVDLPDRLRVGIAGYPKHLIEIALGGLCHLTPAPDMAT